MSSKTPVQKNTGSSGFTIIEVLIAMFLVGTVIVGLFSLFTLAIRLSQESERRVVAVALANERAEMIRNLPYASVGTQGGIPAGTILQNQTITRNTVSYVVVTDIRYIDDVYDGTATSNPVDLINTDYKQARIEVSWNSSLHTKPVLLVVTVAPAGIEGGQAAGTLVFRALDANAAPVGQATVTLDNTAVNPQVHISTATDNNGNVVLPGLPAGNANYKLTVSKSGYNSEQTVSQTSSFFPDAAHTHLTAIAGQITSKTFSIDRVATLKVHTQDEAAAVKGNIAYRLRGTKSTGTNSQQEPVLVVDANATTDAVGLSTHANIIWDSYDIVIDGVATGYDIKETSVILPAVVNPNDTIDLYVTLVPHVPVSLQVAVVSSTNQPIDNATVTVSGNGYMSNKGTGLLGQVFFGDMTVNGDYTVAIDAPGFLPVSQTVTVANTSRIKISMAATP